MRTSVFRFSTLVPCSPPAPPVRWIRTVFLLAFGIGLTLPVSAALLHGSISGKVSTQEGFPLEGATVRLLEPLGLATVGQTTTGADGRYSLAFVDAGTYLLEAHPPDGSPWVWERYPSVICPVLPLDCFFSSGEEIEISPLETVTDIDFYLDRGARIEGKIFTTGTPVPVEGVPVVVSVGSDDPGIDALETAGVGVSDAEGRYVVQGLRPTLGLGYRIWTDLPLDSPFADTAFPNTPCGSGCTIIEGEPYALPFGGTAEDIDLTLWPQGSCGAGLSLCLGDNGRFKADVKWENLNGRGDGRSRGLTLDSGYFWFFDSTHVELVIKLVDGCDFNGHFWIYVSGLTDVAVDLTVVDTETEATWTRSTSLGEAFPPMGDIQAFACP